MSTRPILSKDRHDLPFQGHGKYRRIHGRNRSQSERPQSRRVYGPFDLQRAGEVRFLQIAGTVRSLDRSTSMHVAVRRGFVQRSQRRIYNPNLKAVILNKFGGPEVLRFEDLPQPKPAAGEVSDQNPFGFGQSDARLRRPRRQISGKDPTAPCARRRSGRRSRRSRGRSRDAQHRRSSRRDLGTPCKTCEACLRGDESQLRRQQTHRY